MEADMEYAAGKVRELDQWAKGFLTGAISGAFMMIGLIWAIMGPLK